MTSNCTYEYIQANFEQACLIAQGCDYSYFNFYEWHYCTFDARWYATMPILLIILGICFFLLSDTSNKYLSTSLAIISDKLNISQNLAGVTFLALGNGAPDVISSFVASGGDDGIEFSLGALIGAAVFVSGVVLSSVVLLAGTVKVDQFSFIRDNSLFIVSLALLIIFSIDGKIRLWESIVFLMLYFV